MRNLETMSMNEEEIDLSNPQSTENSDGETEASVNEPEQNRGEQSEHQHINVHKQRYEEFLKELETKSDVETKLQFCIDFMAASLAQGGTPHFRSFWDARTLCLQLFKENVAPVVRSILWDKYNELSKEARRLKDILDEQSAFAVEQIEIAIKALEDDINNFEEQLQRHPECDLGEVPESLTSSGKVYQGIQKELNLLNTYASRINALRKELMRTEMRVKQKNKFFQRLSASGDHVFPKRKELIKEVSSKFIQDVDNFIEVNFKGDPSNQPLFALREEIKSLQNIAKLLTLNTHAFTHTRMRLSECWDEIKGKEKEKKKERAEQKVQFKQNFDDSLAKIHAFRDQYQAEPMAPHAALKQLDEISSQIRQLRLDREDNQKLKEEFLAVKKPILDILNEAERARQEETKAKELHRIEKIKEFKQKIQQLFDDAETLDAEQLTSQRDALNEMISAFQINKAEKMEFERLLKPLKDVISEKRENSLLTLSDDKRQARQQLKEVLRQKRERRKEIKEQMDKFRKTKGSSGLDFTQAMNFNAQIEEEKNRLEKIDQSIEEIEEKIAELEGRA